MIYSINEGQQAEEYKARKAKEAEEAKKAEIDRTDRRDISIRRILGPTPKQLREPIMKYNAEQQKRYDTAIDAQNKAIKYANRTTNKLLNNLSPIQKKRNELIQDANKKVNAANRMADRAMAVDSVHSIRRHIRRHPDQYKESCGIFSSIAFI